MQSMEAKITETYLYYLTAKEIWDVVTRAYSDLENYSQVFELINKAWNMRQGEGNWPFYTKNSLQGEKESEENFWEICEETPIPLPSPT